MNSPVCFSTPSFLVHGLATLDKFIKKLKNIFTPDPIVITDEEGRVCTHQLKEAHHFFHSPIQQVKRFKKPVQIIIGNQVYIITLKSRMTKNGIN